jgi:hypothetical protein
MSGSPTTPVVPTAPVHALLAPSYVVGLDSLSLSELRGRRTECALVESSMSYERQLIQGRLDIVCDELNRRGDDEEACDVTDLVERLPQILTLHAHAVGMGRPPTFMFPVHLDPQRQANMDRIAPASAIGALAEQSTEKLSTMSRLLLEMEHEVSAQRRALHQVFDRIQEEVIRRYKSGEIPVDGLLAAAGADTVTGSESTDD